jgi:uncharacterized membrane protein YfcA
MFIISHFIVVLFGVFLIFAGFLMIFKPEKTKEIISKAGSTYLINYTELGIRLFIGIAFVISSKIANYEFQFKIAGYFLIVSALILMCLPIKLHNKFSRKAAEQLKPIHLKIFGPISILFGFILTLAFKN